MIDLDRPLQVTNRDNGETHLLGDLRPNDNQFWPFISWSDKGRDFYISKEGGDFVYVKSGMSTGDWVISNITQPAPNPATIERCVELVRELADKNGAEPFELVQKARSIMAELEPVDTDLLEARKIAVNFANSRPNWDGVGEGKFDDHEAVQTILAAIKRGRELASQENSRG